MGKTAGFRNRWWQNRGRKRHPAGLARKVTMIYLAGFLAFLICGAVAIAVLRDGTMKRSYEQAKDLVDETVTGLDEQVGAVYDLLYRIVTSDDIQRAGSELLDENSRIHPSAVKRQTAISSITGDIQRICRPDSMVRSAYFMDGEGNFRGIAIRGHTVLDEDAMSELAAAAMAAEGDTVTVDGASMTGNPNTILLAREIREKRDLSMRHIGVAVIECDLNALTDMIRGSDDNICLIRTANGLSYVLGGEDGNVSQRDAAAAFAGGAGEQEQGTSDSFRILTAGGRKYFAVRTEEEQTGFSYLYLSDYDALFLRMQRIFRISFLIFVLTGTVVAAVVLHLTRGMILDIQRFTDDIAAADLREDAMLPEIHDEFRERELFSLQNAYNALVRRVNQLVEDNYKKQILIRETRLQELQSQINPHFLYNTLNSIYWMTKTAGVEEAAVMVSSLAMLLRDAISDHRLAVPVDKELGLLQRYLVIQKQRYAERLQVRLDISPEVSDCVIPKLMLQPLVENAITYGLEATLDPCRIEVSLQEDGTDLICQVRNSGPAPEADLVEKLRRGEIRPKGHGVGLLNIDQRVKYIYGEQYGVRLYRDGDRTAAEVRMGRRTAAEEDYGQQE